jgi:enoyl-CoA hydratase
MTIRRRVDDHIAEVVIHRPPVNALDAASCFELADAITALGRTPEVHVVILSSGNAKGFCAGIDIKEQAAGGHAAMLEVNRGCAAAFSAVYDCEVPVIAAVHGYCLGAGIGLVANADIIVAAEDATFGLPEVERGVLGAATHLSRLVPQHRMRAMYYTAARASAEELHRFGSVHEVVDRGSLDGATRSLAAVIAAKDPHVIRLAKRSINGIDPVDVHRSYRYEQGFTFQLSLGGGPGAAYKAFLSKKDETPS